VLDNAGASTAGRLTKRQAAYWEISLSQASDQQLAEYDFLVVNPRFGVSLNTLERDRLRRFVDGGGVLLIDVWTEFFGNTQIDPTNNFPLAFGLDNGVTGNQESYFTHPLLSFPAGLNARELAYLNFAPSAAAASVLRPVETTAVPALQGSVFSDFANLQHISSLTRVLRSRSGGLATASSS
jgi:hypothetical protein